MINPFKSRNIFNQIDERKRLRGEPLPKIEEITHSKLD
jgi:hypothetical protein